jgi:hypothetical protein
VTAGIGARHAEHDGRPPPATGFSRHQSSHVDQMLAPLQLVHETFHMVVAGLNCPTGCNFLDVLHWCIPRNNSSAISWQCCQACAVQTKHPQAIPHARPSRWQAACTVSAGWGWWPHCRRCPMFGCRAVGNHATFWTHTASQLGLPAGGGTLAIRAAQACDACDGTFCAAACGNLNPTTAAPHSCSCVGIQWHMARNAKHYLILSDI